MTTRDILLHELEKTPDSILGELLEVLRALKSRKSGGSLDTALASESSLKKDWLSTEEDEAWSGL